MAIGALAYGAWKLAKPYLQKHGAKMAGKIIRGGAKMFGGKGLANKLGDIAQDVGDKFSWQGVSDFGKGLSSKKKKQENEIDKNDNSANSSNKPSSEGVNYYKAAGINSKAKYRYDSFFE